MSSRYIRFGYDASITNNFDQGSFSSVAGTNPIRITPYRHWNNVWAWWALHMKGGVKPTFLIDKANHYNLVAGERLCCWAQSPDTDTWNDFDHVNIGAIDIEFYNDSAFPSGDIYVSALPMYPFSRIQRKVIEWAVSPWVTGTASTTNFVLGRATPRSTIDGRTVPALPFYGFKITGDRVGDKNKAILSAYNHPSETPGPFQLEGAIDYLLGASAEAEVLRDYFEFYVYPCLNPQGVWSGYFRSCPQNATLDHNRQWATTGTLECIDAIKTAMAADTGGTINVGIDYHSWMSNTDIFADVNTGDTGGNYGYFNAEMQVLDADFSLNEETISTWLMYLWKDTYSASLSMAFEQGGELARNPTTYKTSGQHSMQALYEMLVDGRFTYGP